MLMGVGNLTELTDADTTGITMTLMGMVSELAIRNILVVQVSPHCRRAVAEAELARRIMFAAKADGSLPQGYDPGLMALRDRRPFLNSPAEIAATAAEVGDANWRIEVAAGRHPCLQSRRPPRRQRPVRPVSRSSASSRTAVARVLSRRRAGPGAGRASARQALCPGQRAALGRGRAAASRGPAALRPGRQHAGGAPQGPPGGEADAVHPREHRHHA